MQRSVENDIATTLAWHSVGMHPQAPMGCIPTECGMCFFVVLSTERFIPTGWKTKNGQVYFWRKPYFKNRENADRHLRFDLHRELLRNESVAMSGFFGQRSISAAAKTTSEVDALD